MASRFVVVDAPTRQPAVDYITGTAVGPFVDTGRDIIDQAGRNLGRIYISKGSVAEMARELGIVGGHSDRSSLDAAYRRGKLDALKESLGGDLVAVADALRRLVVDIDLDLAAGKGEASY